MSDVPASERAVLEDGGQPRAPGTVTMPATGDGARRARRGRKSSGHRRSVGFGVVVVGLVAALAALVTFGYRSFSEVGEDLPPRVATETSVVPDEAVPPPPKALVVQQSADGSVVGVTLLVVAAGGEGGDLVFAPVGSMVEVPSFGLSPLRDAFALGGLPLLQQAVENLFGITFDEVAILTPDALTSLVEPAGVLRVELPSAVEVVTDAGRVETVFPAGPVDIAPAAVPALLEQRGSGSDLDRLVRHQAFWRAWLAAIGGGAGVADGGGVGGLGAILAQLGAGEVGYDLLPVEVLATGTGPGDDLYAVQGDELDELVREIAPGAAGTSSARVRVQVLNGTGVPGLAQQVQPALVPAGAVVSLTGNADRFDYEITQVVFYRDDDLESARAVQRALGVGEVVRSLVALDVVDVTVVIGADFVVEATTTTAEPGA